MVKRGRDGMVAAAVAVAALCAAAPAAHAANDALLGEWRFAEIAGDTVLDRGPFGLDGRLGAAPGADPADPVRIAGVADGALRFDGSAFVRLPDADELAPETLSVEAVVRAAESPGRYRYIMSRGSRRCFAGAYGLYTGAEQGLAFYVFDGSDYVVTATARPEDVWDGRWHHVAATFDGGLLRLYVDGRPVGEPARAPLNISYERTTPNAAFGDYVGTCSLPFEGDLDMVRLTSGARTPAEIGADAAKELRGPLPAGPLPPAAPPARRDATVPPGPAVAAPGAPARACRMKVSRKRITVRRRTAVQVRVTVRGRPARRVRVVAKRKGKRGVISAARTSATGRARLVLRVRRPGRVRVSAATSPRCATGYIRVAPRRR